MTTPRVDPVLASNFRISLLDSTTSLFTFGSVGLSAMAAYPIGGFSECTGLEMALEVHELMQGGGNDSVLKFPTRIKPATLVLKKGLTSATDLWEWFYSFVQGYGKRRDGVITVADAAQNSVTAWGFRRGLPVKYSGPQLVAAHSAVAIESIEIAHEGLYLMGDGQAFANGLAAAASAISSSFP
ncbi:MAG TPA: phage tail protein [Polyangia bacterium]|jgi:phage tail-like protein|nr:phage tail protein [Polyangia bacterium]HWE27542.1 phage tail protein [Polyangia bacterium]